jgi:hypothetical protein
MGLFGGGNSSTATTITETQINRQLALGEQSQGISGDGNSINVTASDHGSVVAALEVSSGAVKAANDSLMESLGLAGLSVKSASQVALDAIQGVVGVNRDSLNFASVVNRDSLELAARGQSMIATSAAESLGMVGHVVDLAFRSSDASSIRASDAGMAAANLVGRAYDTATGYQAEKQTADSKYLLYAALAAVAIVAFKAM